MLGPVLLIVLGFLFLLNNLYPSVFRFGKMWPVILIVIGVSKVLDYLRKDRSKSSAGKDENT
ncbi:MAG: hypothetical protein DMG13_08040 [Acidobacteria bacterium]|nr:MAG: hypothetical protein DMG13_08040 [Acidobacteriota bacterium]